MLGVAIVKGTARVSIAIVLAVDYSALYSFLNLMDSGMEKKSQLVQLYKYDQQEELLFLFVFIPVTLSHLPVLSGSLTSRRRMQWTMTMMKPSSESNTAKRIWKRAERRSVMARTADIQVRARRGRTTQELHSDALQGEKERVQLNRLIHRTHSLLAQIYSPPLFWL